MGQRMIDPKSLPLTGGDVLVAALAAQGVRVVFGLPGVQLDAAFDALARQETIRVYHTRHEQATSHMADGYARVTGGLAACLVVPGPGVLNAGSGLATAYACNSPLLCVAGQVVSTEIGSGLGLLHELPDQLSILRGLTRWANRARRPQEIPALIAEAARRARSGRPGPTAVEVPWDVLETTCEPMTNLPVGIAESRPPDGDALEEAAARLHRAQRPLIVAGGGVLAAGAWDELRQLAERLHAPVLLTGNGKGALSARHPLAFEPPAAPNLIRAADVIVAAGTRFATHEGTRWRLRENQQLIRIEVDPEELARGPQAEIALEGDVRRGLELLTDLLPGRGAASWRALDRLRERVQVALEQVQPQAAFAHAIRAALPDEAVVVDGMTQVGYWARIGFPVYAPRTFLTSGYQGTLGFELPTGLGAQVAAPDRRVVIIVGDGGLLFNLQELATAVQHRLPVIVVVFNDRAYGNVRRIQHQRFGRAIASELHNPNFPRLAESFGLRGLQVTEPNRLTDALQKAQEVDEPVLIEVPVGEMADPWPLILRTSPL
jgi:acetolactate synthase-1/2/3 large subunit